MTATAASEGELLRRLPAVTAALASRAGEHDRSGAYPADGIAAVHEAGLLTATVGTRHGGPGAHPAGRLRHPGGRPRRPGRDRLPALSG